RDRRARRSVLAGDVCGGGADRQGCCGGARAVRRSAAAVMRSQGRLPIAKGIRTLRVRRALRLYRRVWADGVPVLPLDRRVMAKAMIHALMEGMTLQELAEYYAG